VGSRGSKKLKLQGIGIQAMKVKINPSTNTTRMNLFVADLVIAMLMAFPERATAPLIELLARKDIGKLPYVMLVLCDQNEEALSAACKALTSSNAYFLLMKNRVYDALMNALEVMKQPIALLHCMTAIHHVARWGEIMWKFEEHKVYKRIVKHVLLGDNMKIASLQYHALRTLETFAQVQATEMVQYGICKMVADVMQTHTYNMQVQLRACQLLEALSMCRLGLENRFVVEGALDAVSSAYGKWRERVDIAKSTIALLRHLCFSSATFEPNVITNIRMIVVDIATLYADDENIQLACVQTLTKAAVCKEVYNPEAYNKVVDAMRRFPGNRLLQCEAFIFLCREDEIDQFAIELIILGMQTHKESEFLQEYGCRAIQKSTIANYDVRRRAYHQAFQAMHIYPECQKIREICELIIEKE
jgi:hypothetical protein